MKDYKIRYYIRIIEVDDVIIKKFNIECGGYRHNVSPFFKNNRLNVVVVEIEKSTDYTALSEFINSNNLYNDSDIFISISTHTDNLIAEIPNFVMEAISKLKFKVNLSFTYT